MEEKSEDISQVSKSNKEKYSFSVNSIFLELCMPQVRLLLRQYSSSSAKVACSRNVIERVSSKHL